MTTAILQARVGNRWNILKYLDNESKIDLIALLSQSLRETAKQAPISASKFYGIWSDDGMTAEEFVDALKADRQFKQDIVGL